MSNMEGGGRLKYSDDGCRIISISKTTINSNLVISSIYMTEVHNGPHCVQVLETNHVNMSHKS